MPGLYFSTNNDYKFQEYARIAAAKGLKLVRWAADIREVQEIDFHAMARHKALEAYRWLLRPVLIDVSGMRLNALNGLPGGLNRQFWDLLHDNICDVVHRVGNPSAAMVVTLALCDGRKVLFADGEVAGALARHESPNGTFHLDRTFVPTGDTRTLSDLSEVERDRLGPRSLAMSTLTKLLEGSALGRELGL